MSHGLRVLGLLLTALATAAGVWGAALARRQRRTLRRRAGAVTGAGAEPVATRKWRVPARWAPGWAPGWAGRHRHNAVALAVGAGAALFTGGAPGLAAGALLGAGTRVWLHRRAAGAAAGPAEQARADRIRRQLPLAADLMAACLAAGADPRQAAEAVGSSLGGPLGERLAEVAAELRLGADPAQCWGRLGAAPETAVLGRRMARASGSGAPPVRPVAALATQCRADAVRAMHTRARRAGVLATAPLGICFLPAFLLVGVAPLVIGLARAMFAGAI
jgi:Flp pilus assembly protein TadB